MKYKSYRFVNGKARWVVVGEIGKIINIDPTKEELKGLYKELTVCHNFDDSCNRCGKKFISKTDPRREYINEEWTGNRICQSCYYITDYKFRKTNRNNIIKSLANSRTGNLDNNCSTAKGNYFQKLTCVWRSTISTIRVKDLNIENDNYNTSIDHSIDGELGIIQTKGKYYDPVELVWKQDWKDEHKKNFNYMIFYCTTSDGKYIERIYIFPKEEIIRRSGIGIYKYSRGKLYTKGWYEDYRINDENTIKKINEIWYNIFIKKQN